MPQQINLNVSPYFDDFDATKNYHKVLFKPGYPVQARELTTLQSILQNQIEQFGNHVFKEGSVVIPGNINYNNQFFAVKIENQYLGINVNQYISDLIGKTIIGDTTKVEAKIVHILSENEVGNEYTTLYVNYLASGIEEQKVFADKEKLILQETFTKEAILIQGGEGFATTTLDSTSIGSAVVLSSGVYFLRGNFVEVLDQVLILDPYSNIPSYKIGLDVIEEIITSDEDDELNDNAQGFSNYAAPGADRFKITAYLSKREITDTNTNNFVSLLEVREGNLIKNTSSNPQYDILLNELARRTSDESGDYYVTPFTVIPRETLNDLTGNNGVFESTQLTYNNNTPSKDLGTYKISPGKAYVKGYEVNIPNTVFVDFEKPRTTKKQPDANIQYLTGSTYTLNRVYGAPNLNLASPYIVSLRDQRVGTSQIVGAGKEIGLARVYDYALESGSYTTSNKDLNEWDLSLFDIETYTEIRLNQPITLTTPVHIKGKASGATGFLRFDVNNVGILTVYGVKGSFANGEKFIFNGNEKSGIGTNSRISIGVTEYTTKDVKSVSQVSGITTVFTGDIVQSPTYFVGIASVSSRTIGGASNGISTISISNNTDFVFTNNIKVDGLVKYTAAGISTAVISRVLSVSDKAISVIGVTTVSGICEGTSLAAGGAISDLVILGSKFQPSPDNTLYTVLPKPFIESVDFTDSNLTIRKEFSVSITSNQTNTVTADNNEFFLPFDEERYVLTRSDGTFEVLTSDKLVFDSQSKQLTIYGLGTNDTNARLIATLTKNKVTSKVKNKNRINSVIVNYSQNSASGIGSTTLNDGLTYGSYPYGTRVQDQEISLNVPDVTKLYAVLESTNTNDPISPAITFSQLNGPTAKTNDLLVGEYFIGKTSKAVGIYVAKNNDLKIDFVYLNERTFQDGEIVTFQESGIVATILSVSLGSPNIIKNFTLSGGQEQTILNYSKVIRNNNTKEPIRKLKFIFESAGFLSSDQGDVTTVNSYSQFDYCDIPVIDNNISNSDILDIRPRVSTYTPTSGSRSPFEFLSRTFSSVGNSGKNILASDESIVMGYAHYLPRIDRLFLTKDGLFQLNKGEPDENPQPPTGVNDALEVATMTLPPYLCNVAKISISLLQHKRYQMKDISRLEDRLTNLETFTTLNLLEVQTDSLKIKDSAGLDRFKSGFFVDNFTSTDSQNKTVIQKNSIDVKNSELRPRAYTTSIDLLLGSKSLVGIGQSVDPTADPRFVTDLVGNNVKRTGQLLTLNYEDVEKVGNPFATRSINVTPFLIAQYIGNVELSPDSDTWVDQVRLEPRRVVIDTFTQTKNQLVAEGWDPQTGYSPIKWDAWQTDWVGTNVSLSQSSQHNGYWGNGWWWWGGWWGSTTTTTTATTTTTLGQSRTGTRQKLTEKVDTASFGDYLVSSELTHFMRSRNIQFTGKKFRPFSRVYSFFDGQDVNDFITPKLLEITMTSGVFEVGETVVGIIPSTATANNAVPGTTLISIVFRVAQANHKYGPFNNPTDVYIRDPYNQTVFATLPANYSATSSLLNVDVASLAEQSSSQFYGGVFPGLLLKGQTSGATATVNTVRLVTDNVGTVIGSFLIPNPNFPSAPIFETGVKTFRLTSNPNNEIINDFTDTKAEANYYAQGLVNSVQETIVSVKSPKYTSETFSENRQISSQSSSTSSSTTYNHGWGWGWGWYGKYGSGGYGYCYRDPIAQSFYVEEQKGIFVTKIDLYFRTKDTVLPVTVQLRPMSLGIPKDESYPFSTVDIDAKDVNVSEDGSVKTTVTFPSPVYLQGLSWHSIVLLSSSGDYEVWISRLGEIDKATASLPESQQVVVTEQPLLGSLFKSQNGSTWTPSQEEDLKFTLYKAKFDTSVPGNINFFNPDLGVGNKQIANLLVDSLEFNSRRLRVGLSTNITDTNLVLGNIIGQRNSNATGNYVGAAGSISSGTLTITNAGLGYSNGTFNNVSLVNVTGTGVNATANITFDNNVATAATISVQGSGYRIGDVLTANSFSGSSLGQNLRLTVSAISSVNELLVDNVQGNFTTGTGSTITFIGVGIGTTNLNGTNGNVTVSYTTVDSDENEGLYIRVNHKNHGMISLNHDVILSDVYPDSLPSFLTTDVAKDSTADISLTDMIIDPTTNLSIFNTFENVSVSSTNPGYVKIQDEIIAYTGVSGNTLTGITRSIDQTKSFLYTAKTPVFKYEVNGISLRRINKTHNLSDSSALDRSSDLDYYTIKIDTSQAGKTDSLPYGQVDRSVGTSFPVLYINKSKSAGGPNVYSTQNIPFELLRTNIQTLKPANTNITAEVKTINGSSVDGTEESYVVNGFEPINLDDNNYFSTPRIIASKVNETNRLSSENLPGNKSFTLNLKLASADPDLSPAIDLDRVNVILTSNRINNPITNYATDGRTSSLTEDPCAFTYVSKPISLETPASSIKIITAAYINQFGDLRAFYAIMNDPNDEPVYYPFPGYNNLTNTGAVIDPANNDGLPDSKILTTDNLAYISDQLDYRDYEFTANNLPDFRHFSIKLIGSSTNQAHPPRLRDLRVIALA